MATSSGGSRKLLWLLVVLVVIASSAAATALFMVMSGDGDDGKAMAQEPETIEHKAPIFVEIEPFTVNLADDDYGSRLLYAGISLKVADEQSQALLTEHMPEVRSRLLMLLSGKQAADLASQEDKRRLAEQVKATLEAPMVEPQPELAIENVLFTEFIVQ
ncbi:MULTISPECIES: flagellar basal body-associated protein FliL [Halomonas]|uniref:Flagellar protein FliL n=1 Tax=Halomonas halophila TaxID=29573 RepID=A0ABQ0U9K7_9GAMM|nr:MULTISPECIES: flagellar basal body-associated protein FliL [Halomonas]MDR5889241.1 flagellar basal body-associated protein FliL [Halomonas salina]RAH37117.1 flagellar basal body-associated protein FliL [Halomonas sp. SL1]WJY07205.1 flagellar basal body-associated protein FliL [Halomonas halophila]GEK74413.1 flagellar basal body protein FliL [Halomonas halophila]